MTISWQIIVKDKIVFFWFQVTKNIVRKTICQHYIQSSLWKLKEDSEGPVVWSLVKSVHARTFILTAVPVNTCIYQHQKRGNAFLFTRWLKVRLLLLQELGAESLQWCRTVSSQVGVVLLSRVGLQFGQSSVNPEMDTWLHGVIFVVLSTRKSARSQTEVR